MFIKLQQWIKQRHKYRQVEMKARQAFQQTYPGRRLSTFPRRVEAVNASVYVVVLGYDNTRPPRRSWWKVDVEDQTVSELSYDEAGNYIEHPKIWR